MSTRFITIPIHLAKLLIAEPSDITDPTQYENVNGVAKSMLALLVSLEQDKDEPKPKRTYKKRKKGVKWSKEQHAKFAATMKKKWANKRGDNKE